MVSESAHTSIPSTVNLESLFNLECIVWTVG